MIQELLQRVAVAWGSHPDLPEDLGRKIAMLADSPGNFQGKEEQLLLLLEQLAQYDPYADCSCFGSGATLGAIRRTVKCLMEF